MSAVRKQSLILRACLSGVKGALPLAPGMYEPSGHTSWVQECISAAADTLVAPPKSQYYLLSDTTTQVHQSTNAYISLPVNSLDLSQKATHISKQAGNTNHKEGRGIMSSVDWKKLKGPEIDAMIHHATR